MDPNRFILSAILFIVAIIILLYGIRSWQTGALAENGRNEYYYVDGGLPFYGYIFLYITIGTFSTGLAFWFLMKSLQIW
ncbi:hypothetical protein [Rahnella ecdela]|uniref:Uncharacterized protein n=1 Tax=Rahnella ecdela TaxID=2816250 RepID=A0ABS6LAC4_9GAMM|nr:hypothetical protein [Rahnella ecdela]MBU9843660.1 hypothetical protein [Rahnella ecdela]